MLKVKHSFNANVFTCIWRSFPQNRLFCSVKKTLPRIERLRMFLEKVAVDDYCVPPLGGWSCGSVQPNCRSFCSLSVDTLRCASAHGTNCCSLLVMNRAVAWFIVSKQRLQFDSAWWMNENLWFSLVGLLSIGAEFYFFRHQSPSSANWVGVRKQNFHVIEIFHFFLLFFNFSSEMANISWPF